MGENTPAKRTPAKATTPAAPADVETTEQNAPPQGADQVVDGAEHVTGTDPKRDLHHTGYHDSQTGRPVTESGTFADTNTPGSESQVPAHRIVADDWHDHEKHSK